MLNCFKCVTYNIWEQIILRMLYSIKYCKKKGMVSFYSNMLLVYLGVVSQILCAYLQRCEQFVYF